MASRLATAQPARSNAHSRAGLPTCIVRPVVRDEVKTGSWRRAPDSRAPSSHTSKFQYKPMPQMVLFPAIRDVQHLIRSSVWARGECFARSEPVERIGAGAEAAHTEPPNTGRPHAAKSPVCAMGLFALGAEQLGGSATAEEVASSHLRGSGTGDSRGCGLLERRLGLFMGVAGGGAGGWPCDTSPCDGLGCQQLERARQRR